MAQMDHFDRVNESCGHMGADLVLHQVVERMLKSLRPYDHIGRYRSEQFLIVLSECSHSEAVSIAERICARVGDQPFSTPRRGIVATVSIGVAAAAVQGMVEGSALVKEVEVALSRAGKAGGNCVSASVHSRTSI